MDARVFRGIVLSWERRFDEARADLERSLAEHPEYSDASVAQVNVELWSGHPERALTVANEGVLHTAANSAVLLARARAFAALHRFDEARADLVNALSIDPANVEARTLSRSLQSDAHQWELLVGNTYERPGKGLDGWHEYQTQLKRVTSRGDVFARFSHARRFGLDANQVELEYYPKFGKRFSAYLNAGFSPENQLYPQYRFGGDLIASLGRGFEGSGGMRRLGFATKINIYTGSMAKYVGNWRLGSQFFLAPAFAGSSGAVLLNARRYLGDSGDYAGLSYLHGRSAVEIRTITDTGILGSNSIQAELRKTVAHRWLVAVRTGYSREERLGTGQVNHFLLDTGLGYRF